MTGFCIVDIAGEAVRRMGMRYIFILVGFCIGDMTREVVRRMGMRVDPSAHQELKGRLGGALLHLPTTLVAQLECHFKCPSSLAFDVRISN